MERNASKSLIASKTKSDNRSGIQSCSCYFSGTPQFKSHSRFTTIFIECCFFVTNFVWKYFFPSFLTQNCSHKQHQAKRFWVGWAFLMLDGEGEVDGGNWKFFQHAISSHPNLPPPFFELTPIRLCISIAKQSLQAINPVYLWHFFQMKRIIVDKKSETLFP